MKPRYNKNNGHQIHELFVENKDTNANMIKAKTSWVEAKMTDAAIRHHLGTSHMRECSSYSQPHSGQRCRAGRPCSEYRHEGHLLVSATSPVGESGRPAGRDSGCVASFPSADDDGGVMASRPAATSSRNERETEKALILV